MYKITVDIDVTIIIASMIFMVFQIGLINKSKHIHDDEEGITVIHIIFTSCHTLLKNSLPGA